MDANPELLAQITDEIRRDGPITFARFMELALYAPQLGYYTSPTARIGRAGDFLTAPETHPIFGAAIARHIAATWDHVGRPGSFTVREYGAGTGSLAGAIVDAITADRPDLATVLHYEAIDRTVDRATIERVTWLTAADVRGAPAVENGIVLANEYFDAFPVHRVEETSHGLREVHVDVGSSGLVERLLPPSTPGIAERLAHEGVELAPGQRAEIAFGHDDWFREVAAWLARGLVVVIDYGAEAEELYGSRHRAGTLLGYRDHQVVDDPLASVGQQDLTAHVDLTALRTAAAASGFRHQGTTSQARYLVALGLEELLERRRSDPDLTLGDYLELRSGLVRLLDPRHTGGFKVAGFARGLTDPAPLPGATAAEGPHE